MLFFVMVTLAEQKWIILRERQGKVFFRYDHCALPQPLGSAGMSEFLEKDYCPHATKTKDRILIRTLWSVLASIHVAGAANSVHLGVRLPRPEGFISGRGWPKI